MHGNRRVAVIGSNSFSGADFIDLLLEDPCNEVIGISRSPEKSPLFLSYKRNPGIARFQFRQLDLNRDMDEIVRTLDEFRPSHIVNFAAQSEVAPSWENPDHWYETNVVALSRLTHALKERDYLQRYLHVSSPEVYGSCKGTVLESAPLNPTTPYAASKAAADLHLSTLVKNFGFPLLTVRATNVYGAHQQLFKIIPRSVIYLKLGRRIQLHGGGAAVKSYIHIRDVSCGELAILERGRPGELYHLSPDRGYAVHEVVERICKLMGRDFADSTEVVGERLGQDAAYIIDSSKARTQLGWRPEVSIEDGLSGVVGWIEAGWPHLAQNPLDYIHKE